MDNNEQNVNYVDIKEKEAKKVKECVKQNRDDMEEQLNNYATNKIIDFARHQIEQVKKYVSNVDLDATMDEDSYNKMIEEHNNFIQNQDNNFRRYKNAVNKIVEETMERAEFYSPLNKLYEYNKEKFTSRAQMKKSLDKVYEKLNKVKNKNIKLVKNAKQKLDDLYKEFKKGI